MLCIDLNQGVISMTRGWRMGRAGPPSSTRKLMNVAVLAILCFVLISFYSNVLSKSMSIDAIVAFTADQVKISTDVGRLKKLGMLLTIESQSPALINSNRSNSSQTKQWSSLGQTDASLERPEEAKPTNTFPEASTGQIKAGYESPGVHNCSFVVASVLRRENHVLIEWLEHYIANGACHFYLMSTDESNSTDRQLFLKLIHPYQQKGLITHDHVEPDPRWNKKTFAHIMQFGVMNEFALRRAKQDMFGDWVLMVDLDEFMYSTGANETVGHVLRSVPLDIHQLCVPWKNFQTSGFVEQPPCVVPHFLLRQKASKDEKGKVGKCAARLKHTQRLGVHYHQLDVHWKIQNPSKQHLAGFQNKKATAAIWRVDEEGLRDFPLQLNHYAIQSPELYKYRRGVRYHVTMDPSIFPPGEIFDSELADRKFWLKAGLECGERNMSQYKQFVKIPVL